MNTKAHRERISVHQQLHVLTEMFNQLGTIEPLQGQDIRVKVKREKEFLTHKRVK